MNYEILKDIALAVFSAIGGSGIVVALMNRKNAERDSVSNSGLRSAEATEKVVKAAGDLVEITRGVIELKETDLKDLMKRVEQLTTKVNELEGKIIALEARYSFLLAAARKLLKGIEILISQIDSYGKTPLWMPSEEIREFILQSEEVRKGNRG